MNNNTNNSSFILKLRSITGDFDVTRIRHGLQAIGYDIQSIPSNNGTNFFINGVSTRLLHLHIVPKGLDLSLPSFSTPDDWELMRDFVLVFLTFHSSVIIAENDLVEDIETYFSPEKIKLHQLHYENLLHHSMRNDETLHFYSIHREFFAGTKIFERIREQTEPEQLSFFYELIRKSQYTTLNAENGVAVKMNENLSTTYSILNNKTNIVLLPADMIKIEFPNEEDFFISYSSIDKLIRHGWHYLDEKQIYIPKMNDTDWKNFAEQAKEMSINTALYAKYIEGEDEEGEE